MPFPLTRLEQRLAKPSLILGWPIDRTESSSRHNGTSVINRGRTRNLSRSIQYSHDRHLITFAPTGSGKGVGVIIPNLLHYQGPAIVIDPKGENFAVTARYRSKVLGQRILLLDPFNAVSQDVLGGLGIERQRLNPLDLCQLSGTATDLDAQMLAELFAGDTQSSESPFWDNSAKRVVAGLLAHEMELAQRDARAPRLANVISTLFADDPRYTMAVMLQDQSPSTFVAQSIGAGLIAVEAEATRAGILSTAHSYFSLLTTGNLLNHLDSSSISLRNIQERDDYTLYVVIPPTKLHSHASLLKLWVCVLMYSIMERRRQPLGRTLFILDECANLGEMEVLRKAVTLLRGYGLQVWMFFQDLAQLQNLYPDSGTMINNCGVLQAFGLGRSSAAEPLARLVGSIKANDLIHLDDRQQLLSIVPGRAVIARLLRYFNDDAFAGRFDPNPLVEDSLHRSSVPRLGKRLYL
ncbi:MAG: type IV secretory system conjugative DNA transfer family protein [Bryobacteraceae bacterium]